MNSKKNMRDLTQYRTPEESPGYLLWYVSTRWRNSIEKTLKPLNLTHPQFVVLVTLSWLTKDGDIVNQAEVGRLAGLDPNTTSQIIRSLEAKELVKRIVSTTDERSKNPVVTMHGRDMLTRALPAVEQSDEAFFAQLATSELKDLKCLLQRLI